MHFCNLKSDFLHHEAGEFSGASHGIKKEILRYAQNDKIMDCHADSANLLAMTKNKDFAESALDSADLPRVAD